MHQKFRTYFHVFNNDRNTHNVHLNNSINLSIDRQKVVKQSLLITVFLLFTGNSFHYILKSHFKLF